MMYLLNSSMFHRNTIKVAIPQRILVIDHKTMTLDTLEMKRLDASDRNGNPCEVECEMYSLKYSTGTSLVCQVEKDITVFDSLKIELLQDSNTPVWSFLVLFLLFFVCEIIPIITLLEDSYFAMIGLDRMSMPALENRNVNVALNTPLLLHYEVDVANNLSNEAEEAN